MSYFVTPNEDGSFALTPAGITALVIIMLLALLLSVFLFGRKQKKASAKQIAFSAMAIALATVCSMIKVIKMPMGGSVTLFSMLIVALIGYWYGFGPGLMAGLAYGILQLLIDPYILSLPQLLIDYVFSFMALGLSGLFRRQKYGLLKGYIAAVLGRYFFAFLSGWIFFGMYAGDYGFKSPVVYSLAYNAAYIFTEAGITIAVIALPPVRKALAKVREYASE